MSEVLAKLSAKKQAFVCYYTGTANFNGAEAARRAGYAERSARVTASRLLTNANIQAAIKERITELTMSEDEVLLGLADHARGSMADFVTVSANGKNAYIDLGKAQAADKLHLLKKIRFTEKHGTVSEKTVEIELYDAQAAKIALGKAHKLFTERVEIDWVGELEAAGIDPNAAVEELAERFKEHILAGAERLDSGSVGASEDAG